MLRAVFLWASERIKVIADAKCFRDRELAFELVLNAVAASKLALPARQGRNRPKRKRRASLEAEEGEFASEASEASVPEASEAESSDSDSAEESEEEPEQSELLSFELACAKPLALLNAFIVAQDSTYGKFRRISDAASFLVSKHTQHHAFWSFAREWEQKKTDGEGDKKVGKLLGRECTVAHERYQIGSIKVRAQPPLLAAFQKWPGVVIHGHAVCYDFIPDPTADDETLEWNLGANVFVSADGEDLKNFAGAMKHWADFNTDVYVFYSILKPRALAR